MIAEREYEYEIGQRAELADADGAWQPVTVADRFVGPVSHSPVYVIEGAAGRDACYGSELRPVSA